MQRRSAHEGIQGRILEMAQRRRIACEQVIERYLFGQAPGSTLAWLTRKPDGYDQCTQADLIAFAQLNDAAGSQGLFSAVDPCHTGQIAQAECPITREELGMT